MINKNVERAQNLVNTIEERLEQINLLKEELADSIRGFNNSILTGKQALYESKIKGLIEFANSIGVGKYEARRLQDEENAALTLYLDGSWDAYEFKSFFENMDFIYTSLVVISNIETILEHNPRAFRRRGIYEQAAPEYYVLKEEELSVKKIYYASPGEIVFKGVLEILDKVKVILERIEKTPEFVENIIKRFYNLPKAIRLDRKEKDLRLLKVLQEIGEAEIKMRRIEIEGEEIELNKVNIKNIKRNELERSRLESERNLIEEKERTLKQIRSYAEQIKDLEDLEIFNGEKMEKKFINFLEFFTPNLDSKKVELPSPDENIKED